MVSKTALIVEDDPYIAELLSIHLADMGMKIDHAKDGQEGIDKALANEYSLLILDLMLPKVEGKEVLRRIREQKKQLPILILTLKSELLDKVLSLELGADDYLTKPFSIDELLARVKALLRRVDWSQASTNQKTEKELSMGELSVDIDKRRVTMSGNTIDLTPKQFDLLLFLLKTPGRAYTRGELLNYVWGYEHSGYEHTIDTHINRLRAQIEPEPSQPRYILTVWGVGYRFAELSEVERRERA